MPSHKNKPHIRMVSDSFFGDSGKGKLGDYLAEVSDLIIRANGGANAGHNVGDIALHQLPDGILYKNKINLIGPGVVLDIATLRQEMETIQKTHPDLTYSNLRISDRTTLLFEYHKIIEKIEESARGGGILGTTCRGIGPAYADRTGRNALLVRELLDPDTCLKKLRENLAIKKQIYNIPQEYKKYFEIEYYEKNIRENSKYFKDRIVNSHELIKKYIKNKKNILIVAGQGTFLDINHGTYPFVTSSPCTIDGIAYVTGIPANLITERWGVVKAYATRVGKGPFPTQYQENEIVGEKIRSHCPDHEAGASTGRVRGIGRFDGPMAKLAQEINAFTHINLTRLDILTDIDNLEICTDYKNNKPVYKKMKSWKKDISGMTKYKQLPKEAQKYCQEIMKSFKGAKLALIGTGPNRNDFIKQ